MPSTGKERPSPLESFIIGFARDSNIPIIKEYTAGFLRGIYKGLYKGIKEYTINYSRIPNMI